MRREPRFNIDGKLPVNLLPAKYLKIASDRQLTSRLGMSLQGGNWCWYIGYWARQFIELSSTENKDQENLIGLHTHTYNSDITVVFKAAGIVPVNLLKDKLLQSKQLKWIILGSV